MTARVAGRGNQQEVFVDAHWIDSGGHAFDAARRGAVTLMHDSRTMKMCGKFDVVGDIVTVRKEHKIHCAHFFDALYERSCESRRIDQHVPALLLRTNDQIRPRSE